jgi:hypothetical protein
VTALEPSGTQPSHCTAQKIRLVGSKVASKAKCYAKAVTKGVAVDGTCLTAASNKFHASWTKLEASRTDCLTTGDASSVENTVDSFVNQLSGDLEP